MSFFAKQRMYFYKKFKLDIWGILKNTLQWKIDRSNYYSQNLRDKLRNSFSSFFFNQKEFVKKKKNLYFIIGYKFINHIGYKKLIDMADDLNFDPIIKKVNKYKLDNKQRSWYIQKEKYKDTKAIAYTVREIQLLSFSYILYLKFLLFTFFKTSISQKMEKVFAFLLKRKERRPKIYYRVPFIYEMRFYPPRKKKYKTKKDFSSLRVTKLFYIIYNYRQLKNLCRKAKRQIGAFEQNYLLLLECKLPSFIYRTSFMPNMFESIDFIKNSNVWINKYFINYIYYTVKPFDIIGFRILIKSFLYWNFYKRLRRRAFIFLFPRYIYISIIFFVIIFLRIPLKKEIINPISVDMYRLYNYAI